MRTLSEKEISNKLGKFVDWKHENNCITKTFTFMDFSKNFSFMTRVAMLAEKHNHHPDWCGGHRNLTIQLSTHDAGGVTELDIKLAFEIEKLLN